MPILFLIRSVAVGRRVALAVAVLAGAIHASLRAHWGGRAAG